LGFSISQLTLKAESSVASYTFEGLDNEDLLEAFTSRLVKHYSEADL